MGTPVGSDNPPKPSTADKQVGYGETIGDALRKALSSNRKDGPGFIKAMERFNTALQEIIDDGSVRRWMDIRPRLSTVEWFGLVDLVHDQAHARVVGPYANELEVSFRAYDVFVEQRLKDRSITRNIPTKWPKRSRQRKIPTASLATGELCRESSKRIQAANVCQRFMSKIIEQTKLGPHSVL